MKPSKQRISSGSPITLSIIPGLILLNLRENSWRAKQFQTKQVLMHINLSTERHGWAHGYEFSYPDSYGIYSMILNCASPGIVLPLIWCSISACRPVFGTKICSWILSLFAHDLWRSDRGLIFNTPGRSYSGQSKPGFSAHTRIAGKSLWLLWGNPVLSGPGFLQTGPIKVVYDRAGSFGGGVRALSVCTRSICVLLAQ